MQNISCAPRPAAPLTRDVLGEAVARILARLGAAWRAYLQARAEWRRARETVAALMALSNRELKDIGVSRSAILSLAYGPGDARMERGRADA